MAETLFQLIKVALTGNCTTLTTTPDWPQLYKMAAEQGVAAIAWDGVQRLIREGVITEDMLPDKATKLRWALHVENTERQYDKQHKAILKLADIYAEHGIRMMILKGFGLSLYYPTPAHRSCCDIDIWLFGEQKRADAILREQLGIKIDEDHHHHTIFHIGGVMVENHYDFLNIHAHLSNREIELELRELAEHPEAIEAEGRTIFMPNANCHALFLLRHAAAHFAAVEIVLRHIIDWGLFVKNNHASVDWTWIRGVCREQNMELFLDVINALAADICDIDIALMPGTRRHDELERRVLNDILCPEFSESQPKGNIFALLLFKYRRWWTNRWKHRLVYREGLFKTFIVQIYSHLLKPKSLKK